MLTQRRRKAKTVMNMVEYLRSLPLLFNRRLFLPDEKVRSINDIDARSLKDKGIKAIIFDIDQTLTLYHTPIIPEGIKGKLMDLQKDFICCGLSNYNKKDLKVKKRNSDLTSASNLKVIDSRYTKPDARAIKDALKFLKTSPKETVLIGNCNLTDMIGANRMDIYSIQVGSITKGSPLYIILYNYLESMLSNIYRLR